MNEIIPNTTLLDNSITFTKTVDADAMRQLNAEIEAKARVKAEREAAEAEKRTIIKQAEPEPAPIAPSIREFLNSTPIKSGNGRILALCQKYGIDIDKNPWPPNFPEGEKPESPKEEQKGQLILFPQWEDDRRAAPNAMFRSALFPALKFKEGRSFLKAKPIYATKGIEVYFTGEQFDQSDLDVYLEILNFARAFPLGTLVRFSAYALLKALGRATGSANHKWLHSVLIRLCGGVVDITDHKARYFGHLIEGGIKNEITKEYEIIINPKFAVLFGFSMWATIEKAQRHELGRNQIAKALQVYYATHAAPGPHEYETLAKIAGLVDKNPRKVKMKIIAAHEELKRVGFLSTYEAGPQTIKVTINHTPGQARHIVRKLIKSRSRKPREDAS